MKAGLALILSFSFFAGSSAFAQEMRRCYMTGMTAETGGAKSLVQCEGLDRSLFIADDQIVANLTINLNAGEARADQESTAPIAQIKAPVAVLQDYAMFLSLYDRSILTGSVTSESDVAPEYRVAAKDVLRALRNRDKKLKVNPRTDALSIGQFEVPTSTPLYSGPEKLTPFAIE